MSGCAPPPFVRMRWCGEVGRINGTHGTLEYSPIHYINQSVPQDELFAIYRMADVCLVTSVRDGMNLVSHE